MQNTDVDSGVDPLVQRAIYRLICLFLLVGCRVLWRVHAHGARNVPRTGPVLLAVSHESVLDPVLVGTQVRRMIRYLARDTLFGPRGEMRWYGRFLRYIGAVPIRRDSGSARDVLRLSKELLAAGQIVLIFPEGTRSQDGRLQRFRRGVGMIARETRCPVVPVAIRGSGRLWPKGRRVPRVFTGPVQVTFGSPVTYDETTTAEDVATALRLRVLELRGEEAGDGAESRGATGNPPSR